MTDSLLVVSRIPQLAQRSMRDALSAQLGRHRGNTKRGLIDAALLAFERRVERTASPVRQALLFSERDRIVRELRAFQNSHLAARLFAARAGLVIAGSQAAPFDAIVEDRAGARYGIVMRRLAKNGARLHVYQRVRMAGAGSGLTGVLLYDWSTGATRLLRLGQAGAKCHNGDLRPRRKLQFSQDMRDVILDGLVA